MVINEFKGNLTAVVRSVVLQAWRERWTDEKWSLAIKKYLPYIEAADNLLLSNILLEQATISASPNMKLLEYLKYAIYSQMTTFSATVQNILVYKDISQPYCLSALVGFLSGVYDYPFFNEAAEDALELSKSLLLAKVWVMEITMKGLMRLNESKCPLEIVEELLKSCSSLLTRMSRHGVCNNLIRLSLSDHDADVPPASSSSQPSMTQKNYSQKIEHLSMEINRMLSHSFNQSINEEIKQAIAASVRCETSNATTLVTPPGRIIEGEHEYLALSTNLLVVMETYLFPCHDMQVLAEKLVMLEQLQGIERQRLYCAVLSSCYLGLLDESIKPEDTKWTTFVYIRVPLLFMKLFPSSKAEDKQSELCSGIELLLGISYLLDAVDSKCNSDCLQILINEFIKHSLLTDIHVKKITSKRQPTSLRSKLGDNTLPHPKEHAYLILRAEPTLSTILKSLDGQKNAEMILRVMNPLMCGKSFELVSSVAAATGKLQSFVERLIRVNEISKMAVPGESLKNSQIRATLFDISFLLLCHIVQIYGLEVITGCAECRATFFYQWATRCLPDGGRFQSIDGSTSVDPRKVELLLEQLSSEGEFKTNLTKWDEVCLTAPQAVQEVIVAWQLNAIDQDSVKMILDTLKNSMCCLAVVVSTFLCNLISAGSGEAIQMESIALQQLSTYSTSEVGNGNNYHERSNFARQFIHFLRSNTVVQAILPTEASHQYARTIFSLPQNALPIREMKEKLLEVFQEVYMHSCLKVEKLLMLERIYDTSSTHWFTLNVMEAMCMYSNPEDLVKAVCVAHSFFQIDLEELTACLINCIIPGFLMASGTAAKYLTDPFSGAIIKLAILNIASLHRMKQACKDADYNVSKRKRKRSEYIAENPYDSLGDLEKPLKQRRESENQEGSLPLSDNFLLGDVLCSQESFGITGQSASSSSNSLSRDHLTKPITNLLSIFHSILMDRNICAQTDFALNFIRELLKTGTTISRYVLQNAPSNLVNMVAKLLHGEITPEQIFMFGDSTSASGKSAIAKAIYQAVKHKSAESCRASLDYV